MTAVLRGAWRLAITLLALPFALIGWLWICVRLAGSGALLGSLLGLLWNVVLLQPPDLRHGVIGLLLGGLIGLVLALLNLVGPISFGRGTSATSHGSAAWAEPRQLRRDLTGPTLARDPAALLVGRAAGRRGALLRYTGPAHLLTIAPTRSGKGVGTVLPNLLLANRPILCVDPKGENARISARARRRFGPVHVLDPFGVSGQPSSAYDPAALLDPSSPDLADDAATLAEALVFDPPGQVSEAHWNEEAKALISGLLLHLACRGAPGQRGLPELRRLLTLPPDDWQALLRAMLADTSAAGGLVSRAAARQLGKADREAAGVLSSAQRHTHLLDSPRLAASMARSDFQWSDLRQGSATVFLVLPPDRLATYSRWLRLLIAQSIQQLARTPASSGQPPVLLLLDEFAALGRLEPVLQAAGLMAGLGLQLWPILQDLAQLRAAYGQSASTFLANAGLLQVSAPADLETAQWLSQALGNSTIGFQTHSSSHTTSDNPEGHGSTSHGSATQRVGRPLLTPDEAMRLPADQQVLLRPGQRPALVQKLRHYVDPEFQGLAD
ncbi:type IV secretory system conjugative DNA transfer family protein [Roseomonas sp. ACRSG]|nr:type IV secretory system conjugative DNA transfer family protein [Roseomonas sp. ACRSG]